MRQAVAADGLRQGDDVRARCPPPRRRRTGRCGRSPSGCRRRSAACRAACTGRPGPRSHSARATLMPPSPCTVSTITAAGLLRPEPWSSSSRSNQRKSGDRAVEVVVERHRACRAPAGRRRRPRLKALPVTASEPSDMPWKALVKETIDSRPLTLRASFSAASTALVPVGPGNMHLVVQVARPQDHVSWNAPGTRAWRWWTCRGRG